MDIKEIDWNEVWKSQMTASHQVFGGGDCASTWDDEPYARNYWNMVLESRELFEKMIGGIALDPDSRILDVGAGPGSLVVPLANHAAHITAVEPAGAMAGILQENIEKHRFGNVRHIGKKWEEIDTDTDLEPPYDIVIASFSLGMSDIREAIEKMVKVSSKYVYLFWFAGASSWDRDFGFVVRELFGKEYSGMPCSNVLFNLLYEMGIYPHTEVFPSRMNHRYASLDDLVEDFSVRMPSVTDEQKRILSGYFGKVIEEHEGCVILPYTWQSMKLWWEKEMISK